MYGYVDLVDNRNIVARALDRTGIVAKNVHCQTAAEAKVMFEGMKRNLAGGFDISDTHPNGFKYERRKDEKASAKAGSAMGF